ncbi:MAG: ribonuclease D [Alphaproteobacteria bacterium]|nr:ribonuclease D [Alphaproteobacteria bacterium]
MSLITNTKDLKTLCKKLHKADFVTVDTEFIRERTYWPKLCLIQVAGPNDVAAIDPLAEGIDLSPFYDLLQDKKVLKVFHACRQDLEIFFNQTGKVPTPVFDTQIAATVCGFGEQVGYENLVNALVKKKLDKSSRFTDWAHRPLTAKQLKYAMADVTHLRPIYEKLMARLEKEGRKNWIRDEMKDLTRKTNYKIDPQESWKRIRIPSAKPRALGILREVAAWREVTAQKIDIPRGRLIKDEALAEIATHPPTNTAALARIRNVSQGFAEGSKGQELLVVVEEAKKIADKDLPQRKARTAMPPGLGPTVDLLRVLLKLKCEESKVAPKLLCVAADLEQIAAFGEEADVPALKGWRKKLFGKEALDLREGKLAIAVAGGRLKLVKTRAK